MKNPAGRGGGVRVVNHTTSKRNHVTVSAMTVEQKFAQNGLQNLGEAVETGKINTQKITFFKLYSDLYVFFLCLQVCLFLLGELAIIFDRTSGP